MDCFISSAHVTRINRHRAQMNRTFELRLGFQPFISNFRVVGGSSFVSGGGSERKEEGEATRFQWVSIECLLILILSLSVAWKSNQSMSDVLVDYSED